jgi:hypothetical protein
MIPLFAIGVFTGFTLSQTGLVMHWRHERPPRWRYRSAVNGLGAVITAAATVIFLITKFTEGAWVVVVAVPTFVLLFVRIHAYYERAGVELGVGRIPAKPDGKETLVIVPVTNVSLLTRYALGEAMSLGQEVRAVSVVIDQHESDDRPDDEGRRGEPEREAAALPIEREWAEWNPGVTLRILHTEFASVVRPIVAFIDEVRAEDDRQIVVLIPVIIPGRFRYRILHNQTDHVLSAALRARTDVVVARVAMPLHQPTAGDAPLTPVGSRPIRSPDGG